MPDAGGPYVAQGFGELQELAGVDVQVAQDGDVMMRKQAAQMGCGGGVGRQFAQRGTSHHDAEARVQRCDLQRGVVHCTSLRRDRLCRKRVVTR